MHEPAILSRRAAAALPLAALFGPATAAVPPSAADTELVDLGRQWLAVHVAHIEHWRAWQALSEAEKRQRDDELDAECEAMSRQEWALEDRIHAIPATTLAGLAVKARIAAHEFDAEDLDIASIERAKAGQNYSNGRATLSLALDVLKLLGAAS